MGKIFKLLIHLKIGEQLFLIDMIYGEDREWLEQLGRDRKKNNDQYIVLLLEYNLTRTKVI